MISDAEMFEYGEAQRALASSMSDAELASALLKCVMGCIGQAESEFACTDSDRKSYDLDRGIVREAAFRLARAREYEQT